jgi:uncharacterized protein YndB with AHSA1/START domain
MPTRPPVSDHTLDLTVDPTTAIAAFFDPGALAEWWHAVRSVTTPQVLGVYAIEWAPTPHRDELFGPLGGVLHGMVMDYRPGRGFLVAEAYWLPPEGDPVGPMAVHVECTVLNGATKLRVLQTGGDNSPRWTRYYELMSQGWTGSLAALKTYLDTRKPSSTPTAAA